MDETKNTPETADGASKGGEGERECPTMYQPNKVGPYGNIVASIEPRNLHEYPSDPDVFLRDLLDNIKKWRDDPAITAIWYGNIYYSTSSVKLIWRSLLRWNVHTDTPERIPQLKKAGFTLHSVRDDFIVLSLWLKDTKNKLPACGYYLPSRAHFKSEQRLIRFGRYADWRRMWNGCKRKGWSARSIIDKVRLRSSFSRPNHLIDDYY